jgi:hypothetical protein
MAAPILRDAPAALLRMRAGVVRDIRLQKLGRNK